MSRRAEPSRTVHRLVAPSGSVGGGSGPLVAPEGRRRRGDGAHQPRLGARIRRERRRRPGGRGVGSGRVPTRGHREMRRQWPSLAVVVVSDVTDTELLVASIRAGARAWVDASPVWTSSCEWSTAWPAGRPGFLRSADGADPDVAHERGREGTGQGCLGRALGEGTGDPGVPRPGHDPGSDRRTVHAVAAHRAHAHRPRAREELEVHNTLSAVSIARKAGLASDDRIPSSSRLPRARAADTVDGPRTSGVQVTSSPCPIRGAVAAPRLQEPGGAGTDPSGPGPPNGVGRYDGWMI